MERVTEDAQERRRHIRALLDVHRLEFQRGYWASGWNRAILIAFFLLLQRILFKIFVPYVGFRADMKMAAEFEAGVGESHEWTAVLPLYTSGLEACLLVLAGLGLVLCVLNCVIDLGDRRLNLFPLDMRYLIDAEFGRLVLLLGLFMAPGMVYAFARFYWSFGCLLWRVELRSNVPPHLFLGLLACLLFAALFFILVLLTGTLLGILIAWLLRGWHQGLEPARIDPMMVAGIATIAAVLLGSSVADWWSATRDSTMAGVTWFPLIGSIIVRGVTGICRVEIHMEWFLGCLLKLLAVIAGTGALSMLARAYLAPGLARPARAHGALHHRRTAHAVHSAFGVRRLSMFTKDLRTFFRDNSAAAGVARWAMVWMLISLVFFGTSQANEPQILRQYWATVLGMRINWAGLFLLMPLEAVVPFFLFYLLLSEERAVLLANTVPVDLRRMVRDKEGVSLVLGGTLLLLWMLLFIRSPFRSWSPLLVFLCFGGMYLWINVLVCLLAPLWVQRDQDAGVIRSIYATPCMLAIVYYLLTEFGGGWFPDAANAMAFGSAIPVLCPLVVSFVVAGVALHYVAVPLSAIILRRRLEPASAAQEAEASGVVV